MDHQDEEFLRRATEAKAKVTQLNPAYVDANLASGSVVIDVRESDEHEKSNVSGAINISIGALADKIASAVPDKATPVICYCNAGNRGSLAAEELLALGYTNVSSIDGGLKAYLATKDEK
jgi:rhodanese-related sulfurtransferase